MMLQATTPLCISQNKTGQATIVVADYEVGTCVEIIVIVTGIDVTRKAIIGAEVVVFTIEKVAVTITEANLPCIDICATNLGI